MASLSDAFPPTYRGDTFPKLGQSLRIRYSIDGTPEDLTGYTIRIHFKTNRGVVTPSLALETGSGGIVIENQTTATGWFNIPPFEVALAPGVYFGDLEYESPAGVVITAGEIQWRILQDVTL